MSLAAGTARIDITPPPGLTCAGGPPFRATGALDPLHATALALSSGDAGALVIALDLLALGEAGAARLRSAIAAAVGVAADAVFLACSHTHGAPSTVDLRTWGKIETSVIADLAHRLPQLAAAAWAARAPARLAVSGTAVPGLTRDRIPGAGLDDHVGVVRIDHADGRPLALVVNAACHPVQIQGCRAWTADVPGRLCAMLRAQHGGEALWLLGPAGNAVPVDHDGTAPSPARAAAQAQRYAEAVLACAAGLHPRDGGVALTCSDAELPLAPLWDAARRATFRAERVARLAAVAERGPLDWDRTAHEAALAWIDEVERLAATPQPATRPVRLRRLDVGDLRLIAIPGEPFGRLRADVGADPRLIIATLTDGCIGYLPTPEAFEGITYEAFHAPRYIGVRHYAADVHAALVAVCRRLLA